MSPLGKLLVLFSAIALIRATPVPDAVTYRLTPKLASGVLNSLAVEMRFRADATGRTLLKLPNHAGGDKDLWRLLTKIRSDNATLQEPSPAERLLISKPGALIVVRYDVASGYDHDPTVDDANPYRPIIRPGWFMVLGSRVFALPRGRETAPVRFEWGPLPAGWRAASNLKHPTAHTVETAQDSVFIGGADVEIVRRRTGDGGILRLAYEGHWGFDPQVLADEVAKVSDAEDRFWGEGGKPFLVTLIPLAPKGGIHASGGRGLSEAFALYEEPTAKLVEFPFLLAHERLHTWIPRGLGGIPGDRSQVLDYWFSEGFTEFYAARLLLRSGAWSLEDFVRQENAMLVRYWTSAARNAPNARIGTAFWTDNAIMQEPYDRGRLLATLWDDRLRRVSGGRLDLDDVMRKERALARRNDPTGAKGTAATDFPKIYQKVGGPDLKADISRYVDQGATVSLPADLYGGCARIRDVSIPAYDSGFDKVVGADRVFAGVRPNSAAYAAGLRDGMKGLDRLDRNNNKDSRVEIAYRVRDGSGVERIIRYLPAGKSTISVQQVELATPLSLASRRSCEKRMSGL